MSHLRKGEAKPIRTGRAARTRVGTFNSPARRRAVLHAVADRVNTGKTTTAAYLAGELHAPAEFIASYASPYGKAAAKVYREQYGTDPQRSGLEVRGRKLIPVFTYQAEELPVLEKAARDYKRTAELLAEPTAGRAQPTAEAAPAVFAPGARVSLYVSDRAHRAAGTVRAVSRNAIGQDVAEILLEDGATTHQAVRFLTPA